jgi:hypothetical protein
MAELITSFWRLVLNPHSTGLHRLPEGLLKSEDEPPVFIAAHLFAQDAC